MHRRHWLVTAGSVLATAIAGCSDDGGTDPGENDSGDDGGDDDVPTDDEQADTDPAVDSLRAELEDADVTVESLRLDRTLLVLDYLTEAESADDLESEVVAVSRAFAATVDEFDDDLGAMECWALEEGGDTFVGTYEIDAAWAREYAAGESSDEEYTDRVMDTVE